MLRGLGPAVLALVATGVLGSSAPAHADGALLPEQPQLSAAAASPALAFAPNGYAVLAWQETLAGGQFALSVTTRPPGGAWSDPQQLDTSTTSKTDVKVAVNARGDAAVAWREFVGMQAYSLSANRPAGGAFAAPDPIAVASLATPAVGVDANGTVTLLYAAAANVMVRDFQVGTSALDATPQPLASGSCFTERLAVAPGGDAVAAWNCDGAVFALRRGGVWTVSPTIANPPASCSSGGTFNTAPSVAIDAQGHPVGLLQTTSIGPGLMCPPLSGSQAVTERVVLPLAGAMTPLPGTLTSEAGGILGPPILDAQVGIAPSGIVAAWNRLTGGTQTHARFLDGDGTPQGAEQTLDATPGMRALQLVVGADGRALLGGLQLDSSNTSPLSLATRPPGGTFGSAIVAAPAVANVIGLFSLGLDGSGEGGVAFVPNPPADILHVRGFDAGAPTLADVSIPATATPGAAVAFAASATDVWGPVSLAWSFGDGGSATAAAPTHAFSAPGAHAVTVTATDAAGNAATRSGTVNVNALPLKVLPHAPTLSNLSLTHATFRVGPQRTAASTKRHLRKPPPLGTTFRFTLDQAATVTVAIERKASGRRSGTRCVKPARRLRGHRRCARYLTTLALTRVLPAGADAVAFSGRIGRTALAAAGYRATLRPRTGDLSGIARRLGFRVVR